VLIAVAAIAVGVGPAVAVFRTGGSQALRSTGTSSPGARPRLRFALVTTQIALTLALLGGSALLLRSLWNVVNIPLGFEASRVVTLSVGLSATRYPTPAHRSAFFEELLARATATPGAVAAAVSTAPAPLGTSLAATRSEVENRATGPLQHDPIRLRSVTPGYFETFRIRVASGRTFAAADRRGEPVAVINESARRILFGGDTALGRRVRFATRDPWYRVVGVVDDVRNGGDVTDAPAPEVYLVMPRGDLAAANPLIRTRPNGHLALRTTAAPADAEAFLRQIVADLDPVLPVAIERLDAQAARLIARPRFAAWLLTAFGAAAIALAAAGLYSVASYLVAQRRRDIGVRIAIGAAPSDVARQVVGEAGRWTLVGAGSGAVLGWMGTRALQSQLHGVNALDPWSWAGALLALAGILALAVLRPAYRAAHVDPVTALRAD
jgi:predicted permease